MKKIMGMNPRTKEINPETAIAFLDLIKKGRKNPEKIESAIESLKWLKDETDNIKEDLKEKYQQEQRGFLYNLYNALLVEREKAAGIEDKFKIVMTALQAIPYYLYTREIKPMLIEKNLIEMSRDNVIIKDFKGTVEALFDFFRKRGLTDIESLKLRVNHLGWYYGL